MYDETCEQVELGTTTQKVNAIKCGNVVSR